MTGSIFPAMGLFRQLAKQVAKPMSQRIVAYGAQHPQFRRYCLLLPGRFYLRLERSLSALRSPSAMPRTDEKKKRVSGVSDAEAMEAGSLLMMEVVFFGLLVLVLIADSMRASLKSALEEGRRAAEYRDLERKRDEAREHLEELVLETERLRARVDELLNFREEVE